MSTEQRERVRAAKRLVSSELLRIKGVTGVGVSDEALNVYLVAENAATEKEVRDVMDRLAPGTPIRFVLSGPLTPAENT
jgi:hypothetical protein